MIHDPRNAAVFMFDELDAWQPFLVASGSLEIATHRLREIDPHQCVQTLKADGRPTLLSLLKKHGVERLSDRQKLASTLGRASRTDSLHRAAEAGECVALQCAIALLSQSGQPPAALLDSLGGTGKTTPLMAAVSGGHAESARLLLAASASVDAVRSMRLTALMVASIRGHEGCCRLLCDARAIVNATDEDGWSGLMYAAIHGHEACVATLLEAGADSSHTKANGFSCLMGAAVGGNALCVRHLREARAPIDDVSRRGWTATEYARQFHKGDTLARLIQLLVPRKAGEGDAADDGGCGHLEASRHSGWRGELPFGCEELEPVIEYSTAAAPCFCSNVDGHSHDESWRERPIGHGRVVGARLAYWCGSRYSHDTNVLQVILRAHGVMRVETLESLLSSPSCGLLWLTGQTVEAEMLMALSPLHKINKFANSRAVLTQKPKLWATFREMRDTYGEVSADGTPAFDFMPRTFLVPEENDKLEEWLQSRDGRRWIFKPTGASCGSGITLHNSTCADEAPRSDMRSLPECVRTNTGVASEYIASPYLVDGYKFDCRLYVLVTSFDPLTIYTHTSGIVRFATESYPEHAADLGCTRAHLCNYAINKTSARFLRSVGGEAESSGQAGSIWSLEGFKRRLQADLGTARAAKVWNDVDRLIVLTLVASASHMSAPGCIEKGVGTQERLASDGRNGEGSTGRSERLRAAQAACCFQLFGFDVMLDDQAKPWLLEVNGDPGLRTESPIFLSINAPMVADLLNLLGLLEPHSDVSSSEDGSDEHEVRARFHKEAALRHEREQFRRGQWRRLYPSEQGRSWADLHLSTRD